MKLFRNPIVLKSIGFLFFILFFSLSLSGQRKIRNAGTKAYENKEYCQALVYFNQCRKLKSKHLFYKGVSNYHCNNLENAITDLIKAYEKGCIKSELIWYLGLTLQSQKKYYQAIKKYKSFLKSVPDEHLRALTIRNIKDCASSLRLRSNGSQAYVEVFSDLTNSQADDLKPVYSKFNDSLFYFNSNRTNKVFQIYKADEVKNAKIIIGQSKDMSKKLSCFNLAGSHMYYQIDYNEIHQYVVLEHDQNNDSAPYYFNSPVNVSKGDKGLYIHHDNILLFESNRAGGYGGYDIYFCYKNGKKWSKPINLGPEINGPYDESSPFLCNDALTLYYSSNKVGGYGGFDIYKASLDIKKQKWSPVVNLNAPVNSSLDDLSWQLSTNGKQAMFSSNRKTGIGGFDIYKAKLHQTEFAQSEMPALFIINYYRGLTKKRK